MKIAALLALATAAAASAQNVATIEFRFADKSRKTVAIELFENDAPQAVANFKKLADKGFYEGIAVHRAIPDSLVQMGDPLARKSAREKVGTGGPGYTVPAEIHRKHVKGAVSAARLSDAVNPQRRSNGSQFFVCLKPYPSLDGQYTVFGQVIEGLDVLQSISNKATDTNDYPIERIRIREVKLTDRAALPAPKAETKPGKPGKRGEVKPEPQPAKPAKKSFWRRMWPF